MRPDVEMPPSLTSTTPPSSVSLDDRALWVVDAQYVGARRHTPEHAWLASVAADYDLPDDVLAATLAELSRGWRVRTSLARARVNWTAWERVALALGRLQHAGVITRLALSTPELPRSQRHWRCIDG